VDENYVLGEGSVGREWEVLACSQVRWWIGVPSANVGAGAGVVVLEAGGSV
jgi:hypothetical protein